MAWVFRRPGSKNWYMAYYVHEETGRKKIIRSCNTDDHTSAMSLAAEIGEIRRGQVRQERVQALIQEAGVAEVEVIGRYPVKDLWEFFTSQPAVRSNKARTVESKQIHIGKFLAWLGKAHPEIRHIDEVTERTAAAFMQSIAKKSGVTRNNYLSSLRSVFAAVRIPLGLKSNVWEAVQRVEAQSVRKENFSIDQIRKIYGKSKTFASRFPGFWPIAIPLAYHTGMRLGDVCTLSWDELDFKNRIVKYVPMKREKKGKPLTYPFHNDWAGPLSKLWKGQTDGPVWPKVNREYWGRRWDVPQEFEALCNLADITTVRNPRPGENRENYVKIYGFHSFRHSHVTEALEAGAALDDVQKTVGHGSPIMTSHYDHSNAAGKRVAEKLPGLRKSSVAGR